MRIDLEIRDELCTACDLSVHCDPRDVCKVPEATPADLLVVTATVMPAKRRMELLELLRSVGWECGVAFSSAVKCPTKGEAPNKTQMKACRQYLQAEIAKRGVKHVLALGNEPLYALTNSSGIMKYRGHVVTIDGVNIYPTITTGMTFRNPGLLPGLEADLRYFSKHMAGEVTSTPDVRFVRRPSDYQALKNELDASDAVAWDVETNGFEEFGPDAILVSIGFTTRNADTGEKRCWAMPLGHPSSPWRKIWRRIIPDLSESLCRVPKSIAHNGKFDARWLRQFGCRRTLTFDTMLAAHLLDENRPKGLKPLAQTLLGVPAWGIDTKDLMNDPLADVLVYNGLDTWYTFELYELFRQQLVDQPALLRVFLKIMMPASECFTDIERQGVWIDIPQLMTNLKVTEDKLAELDAQLLTYLDVEPPFEVNWNPSNFLRWFMFEHLGLPVISRGKTGAPGVGEMVMIALKGKHPAVDLLVQRSGTYKTLTGFLRPYVAMADENDRIHTTFKLTGTVTGRLSSGKAEDDKVSARTKSRGVNLQQVPRDTFVRGLFGAPPGHAFIEADFSQIELRVAAHVAREDHMIHLYQTGQDIHMAMAMRMTGKPAAQVTKEERKKAKAVNFGFLYGMGSNKFIQTALQNYGVVTTLDEAEAFRQAFFDQFPKLREWHRKQRRLATKYGRVQSPIGRVRHLPDIKSEDEGVRAEAARQAINSPVQAFASDLALLSLVELVRRFKQRGLDTFSVGTVHDAINFQAPLDELPTVMPMIKHAMENVPLDRLFGLRFDVPIIADLKVGTRWGSAFEVPEAVVFDPPTLKGWLREHELG